MDIVASGNTIYRIGKYYQGVQHTQLVRPE